MGWLRKAWERASRIQKVIVVIAMLVTIGALSNALASSSPQVGANPSGPATPTATAGLASAVPGVPSAAPVATENQTAIPTPNRPAPTPKPTPKPTPTPSLTLAFSSLSSQLNPGAFATATVKTSPGAYCSIVVEYKSGPSTAAGLGAKDASSTGVASWTWKVGTRTTAGSWPVTVTCSKYGQTKSVTKYFEVL